MWEPPAYLAVNLRLSAHPAAERERPPAARFFLDLGRDRRRLDDNGGVALDFDQIGFFDQTTLALLSQF